ncbi:hypothetical protein EYF80_022520 [Liparis tanakae]|uniref:Uncharacterized protein n=1 Tax=Liparis tanakae TaxID=230148 RepID=A0A4Z2HNX8_9TELE|nr:hypothetical protein EYF80_022520 [Liparis tanakae]
MVCQTPGSLTFTSSPNTSWSVFSPIMDGVSELRDDRDTSSHTHLIASDEVHPLKTKDTRVTLASYDPVGAGSIDTAELSESNGVHQFGVMLASEQVLVVSRFLLELVLSPAGCHPDQSPVLVGDPLTDIALY